MNTYRMPWMQQEEDQNDQEIQSFTEEEQPKVSPKELKEAGEDAKEQAEEAEEKQKENDEEVEGTSDEMDASEYSDEELMSMNWDQIRQIRFLPRFDYATPGGIDSPDGISVGGCKNCGHAGNEDAGDVAISDAEVAPAEGTEEEGGEDVGGLDTGMPEEEPGDEEGLGAELRAYMRYRSMPDAFGFPSMEGLDEIVGKLFSVFKYLILKAAKYARKTYLFARKKISHTFMKMTTVHKLWKFKLERNLSDISEEKLSKFEVEAFPYAVWVDVAKVSLQAFNVVASAERFVFDAASEAQTNMMKNFSRELDRIGIRITTNKRRIDMDSLMDKRRYDSITQLGFSKSQIPNCIRYLGDISKHIPSIKDNPLEKVMRQCVEKSGAYAARLSEAVSNGEIAKGSKEYQEGMDNVMKQTVRIDYAMMLMRTTYALFDQLVVDVEKVFSKYEDATAFESLL